MSAAAKFFIGCLLAIGAISSIANAQTRTFLRLDGIKGESTNAQHAEEIDIESLTFAIDQTGIRAAGGSASPARSRFSVINVTKRVDMSSPQLFIKSAIGDSIPTATITVQRQGSEPQDFLTINLRNVIISSFTTSSGGEVYESVGLSFKVIEYIYRRQKSDGSLDAPIRVIFNVNNNKVPAG